MPTMNKIAYGIHTIEDFFTDDECRHYIEFTENQGYDAATVSGPDGPSLAPGIRNNDRVILDDHELATQLWNRACQYVPKYVQSHEAIGLNERFRFYRYDPGQFFHYHSDGFHRRENGERSRLTFMVYLNDDFEGGETIFDYARIEPKAGMALVFMHGLPHEGAEVLAGRKYVLRTDVMFAAEPCE